ncbi:DUF4878 domain-containing protein [Clostridium sardiniense]|uniref:DUF4878 domain-containing protein n=1 Tax=Clostridium sardiniense TaxID=29369 RepID=A0ABS7KSP4_CLOSR|nr:DUF4878 domain-containing protein [Clostridium sardiniense]MBY0753826.1 DUF4878 domain-containing protein [Clostridium sardiniense]MDQ0459660.1 ketosteroid isomerase-like protein [Clostridium sardiniense]
MKKIILVLVAIFMSVFLISCGGKTEAKDSVKDFFSAYQNMDLSKANEYVEDGGLLQKSIKQFEDYDKSRIEALKYWSSKLNYKILDSEEKDKESKVKVEVTALNGSQIYNEYMQNVQSLRINEATLNNESVDGDAVGSDFDKAFITALENQTNSLITTDVTVILKKEDGKWKIQNDKEVLQAILGGLNPDQIIS